MFTLCLKRVLREWVWSGGSPEDRKCPTGRKRCCGPIQEVLVPLEETDNWENPRENEETPK